MAPYHHVSGARWRIIPSLIVLMVALLGAVPLAGTGPAQVTFPAAPGPGQIVVDEARLIVPLHQVDIEGLGWELKRDHGYPATMVTSRPRSAHSVAGYTIQRYTCEKI